MSVFRMVPPSKSESYFMSSLFVVAYVFFKSPNLTELAEIAELMSHHDGLLKACSNV